MAADEIIDLKPAGPPPARREMTGLGDLRWSGAGECPNGTKVVVGLYAFALAVGILGLALSLGSNTFLRKEHRPYGLLATVAGVGFFVACALTRSRRGQAIEIAAYERGLVYNDGAETFDVRWAEVATVSEALVLVYYEQGGLMERNHYLRITTKGGDDHVIEIGGIEDSERLAGYVHDGTLPHLVPRAVEKLTDGRAVAFGPVAVCGDGLVVGDALLHWKEMDSADLVNGSLVVCRKGDPGVWFEESCAAIPNAQVLLHLIKSRALAELPPVVGEGDRGRPGASRFSVIDQYHKAADAPRVGY